MYLLFLYFHQFLFYHKSQFKKSNKIVVFFKDAYIWVNPISSLSPDLDLDEDYSAQLHLHPPWWQRHCGQDPAISTSVTFPFGEKWALKYLFFQKYFPNQISLCYMLHFKLLIKVLRITLENSNKLVMNNFQTLMTQKLIFTIYLSFVPYLP